MDAIVLSGGAAYGAYEVGILKALNETKGFNPEIITGTSVGAFNAAILTAESVPRLEEIWRTDIPENGFKGNGVLRIRGNPLPYLDPISPMALFSGLVSDTKFLARAGFGRSEAFLMSRGGLSSRISELVDISAFVSCEPLQKTIRKTVSLPRVLASAKKLLIIATNWEAGGPSIFVNQDMPDVEGEVLLTEKNGESAILASTAIPGIFEPVTVEGKLYVDGGVVMNTPLKPAIQAGATNIHIISPVPVISPIDPEELDNTLSALLRVLQIQLDSTIREDVATACWVNAGLDVMERAWDEEDMTTKELRAFIRVAHQLQKRAARGLPYRKVAIHHYFPAYSLGSAIGLLDFTRGNIERLIERGFTDAANHNCKTCGCIVPTTRELESAAGA